MSKGGDDVVIGYWYSMTLHMGLSRGPLNSLVEIWVGDRRVWPFARTKTTTTYEWVPNLGGTGEDAGGGYWNAVTETTTTSEPAPITASGTGWVDAVDVFGGEDKEGGIEGNLHVLMGEATQVAPEHLVTMHAENSDIPLPGYRGVATVLFDGKVTAINPYPKPWKFRVRRTDKGWDGPVFYPEKVLIDLGDLASPLERHRIRAMNPAHIIYECATNRAWGRGLDPVFIDEDSFRAAANQLCCELFGLCLRWTRQDGLDAFVQTVLDHIGAATYISRSTGKLTIKLIRKDYDADTLRLWTKENGILEILEDSSTASSGLVNEVIVNWHDPLTDKDKQARAQSIAGIQAMNGIFSITKDYPGACTEGMALALAQRDLKAQGVPLRRIKLKMDRRAWYINPADVIRIRDDFTQLPELILRVGKVEDDTQGDGSIILTCLQDVFGLSGDFLGPQGLYTPPSNIPAPAVAVPIEYNYRDAVRKYGVDTAEAVPATQGYLGVLARKPQAAALSYLLWTRVASAPFVSRGQQNFTPASTLVNDLAFFSETMTLGSLPVDHITVNTCAWIDDEYVRINEFDPVAKTIKISRGCADTVPARHTAGTRVWFTDIFAGWDPTLYMPEEILESRPCTYTGAGLMDVSLATSVFTPQTQRLYRPYAPGRLNITVQSGATVVNHAYTDEVIGWPGPGPCSLSWTHRDRLTQLDTIVPHEVTNIGPEGGTTYLVEIFVNGIYGDDPHALPNPAAAASEAIPFGTFIDIENVWITAGSPVTFALKLWAVRDGLKSHQCYTLYFDRSTSSGGGYLDEYMWVGVKMNDEGTYPYYALDVWMAEPDETANRGVVGAGFATALWYTDGYAIQNPATYSLTWDGASLDAAGFIAAMYDQWSDTSTTMVLGDHGIMLGITGEAGDGSYQGNDYFQTGLSVNGLEFRYWIDQGQNVGPYDPLLSEADNAGASRGVTMTDSYLENIPQRFGWDATFTLDPKRGEAITAGSTLVDPRPKTTGLHNFLAVNNVWAPQVLPGKYKLAVRAYGNSPYNISSRSGALINVTGFPTTLRRSNLGDYQDYITVSAPNTYPSLSADVQIRLGRQAGTGLPASVFNFSLTGLIPDDRWSVGLPFGQMHALDNCSKDGGPNMGGPSFSAWLDIDVVNRTVAIGDPPARAFGTSSYPGAQPQSVMHAGMIFVSGGPLAPSDADGFATMASTGIRRAMEAITSGAYGGDVYMYDMSQAAIKTALMAEFSNRNSVYSFDPYTHEVVDLGLPTTTPEDWEVNDPPDDSTNFYWYYEHAVPYQNTCYNTYGVLVLTGSSVAYEMSQNFVGTPGYVNNPTCC